MRKKTSATSVGSTPAQVTNRATPVPPVAVLIDGENVNTPTLIPHILAEAGKMGGVTIRQIYGNWSAGSMQAWKKLLAQHELEPMGNRPGPNATDMALTIGAMDLLHRGFKHFCLVAGDRDYISLVHRLRQDGCMVLVIGTAATASALKEVCSKFLSTDQLIASTSPTSKTLASTKPSPVAAPSPMPALAPLLLQAYRTLSPDGKEWIQLAALGNALQKNPTFVESYGKKKLSTLIKECPQLFETRKTKTAKGGEVEEVRSI